MDFDVKVVQFLGERKLISDEMAKKYKQVRHGGYNVDLLTDALTYGLVSLSNNIDEKSVIFDSIPQLNQKDGRSCYKYIIIFNACSLPLIMDKDTSFIGCMLDILRKSLEIFPEFLLSPIDFSATGFLEEDIKNTFIYNAIISIRYHYYEAIRALNNDLADKYLQNFNTLCDMLNAEGDLEGCLLAVLKVFLMDKDSETFKEAYDEWWENQQNDDNLQPSDSSDSSDDSEVESVIKNNNFAGQGIMLTYSKF
ncbi:MAG: hypothetical protein LBI37_00455 [Puniceicoccales bacterium]|jgi:hypothetical protein|nr:hypothetical protein [Puniceicoccales bacterium]